MNPFEFLILILIIIMLQFLDTLLISSSKCDDMCDTLQHKDNHVDNLNRHPQCTTLIHPERTHEHDTQDGDKTNIQIELVTGYKLFVKKIYKRKRENYRRHAGDDKHHH